MAKKPTTTASETPENTGRRDFLRAGAAAALVAVAPATGNAQVDPEKLKRSMDAILRRAEQKPPAQPPAPGNPAAGGQQPAPVTNLAAPTLLGEKTIGGMDGRSVDLDSDHIPHVGGKKAYDKFKSLVGQDIYPLMRIYGAKAAPANPAQIKFKQEMDPVLAEIKGFDRSVQAEVLARIIRDIKALNNDRASSETASLGGVRAILNEFPQAKNIMVQYKRRPLNGQGQYNLEIAAKDVAPIQSRSIREFLTEPTIHMDTELTALANNRDNLMGVYRQSEQASTASSLAR